MRRFPPLAMLVSLAAGLASPRAAQAETVVYAGSWQLTQYWIADERRGPIDAARTARILDRAGRLLGTTHPAFLADLTLEGTGRTWDGRLFNYATRVGDRVAFTEIDRDRFPFGIGVAGYALVPYRSLAVDRRYIPMGSTVEIDDLDGVLLPDGSVHDGCFVAVDTGGAIRGAHVDLFVPTPEQWSDASRRRLFPDRVDGLVVDSPRCRWASVFAYVPHPFVPALPR